MTRYFSLLTTGLLMAICACGLKAQSEPCNDPEAWNYQSSPPCIYIPNCDEGFVPVIFETWLYYGSIVGSQYHLITTDLQDTIMSGSWQPFDGYFANFYSVCIDPEQCYFLDFYPEPENPNYFLGGGPYVKLFNLDFGSGSNALYFSHPGPSNKYRLSFAADSIKQADCGILGCTDPNALNYWTEATSEYECQYCDNNSIIVGVEQVLGTASVGYQIVQGDSVVASGSLPDAAGVHQRMHCLPDGCYELRTAGNPWYFQKLHVYELSGDTLATVSRTQNEPMRHPFGVNAEPCPDTNTVYGCTNPLGANYNPGATMYDGTCDLQNGQCSVNLSMESDSLSGNIQLFTNVVIGGTELIWDIKVDWGDGSPLEEVSSAMTHAYAELGDYLVCVNFYTKHFYDLVPVCHAEACVNINGAELGQQGGFIVGMQQIILSASSAAAPHFELYPNPAQGYFHVVVPADAHGASYHLLTADGRVVSTGVLNSNSDRINVHSCAAGLYLFRLSWPDGSYTTRRVVIQ